MITDARTLEAGAEVRAELCVVGAGAAGITMARELAGAGFRVAVLESGGRSFEPSVQSLYEGSQSGFPYYELDAVRLRYLGGTTNHWAGVCRPLDPHVLSDRPWVSVGGWPLARGELEPYYARAQQICRLGPPDYGPGPWAGDASPLRSLDEGVLRSIVLQHRPLRFGEAYRPDLESARNVEVFLHLNALELVPGRGGRAVDHLRAATLEGTGVRVRAGRYVLATGAIENARLLLASDRFGPRGAGNEHDHVGRYFMDHISVLGGVFLASDPDLDLGFYDTREARGVTVHGALSPTARTQRSEGMLAVRALLAPTSPRESLRAIAPGLVETLVEMRRGFSPGELAGHVAAVARDLDDAVRYSYRTFFGSPEELSAHYVLYQIEQAPNPDSRVHLTPETDRLGLRRVGLEWRFGERERRTLERANRVLASEVGQAGLGRVRGVPSREETGWPEGVRGAWHQMGTTRMSAEPADGVVDPDCRVHGIENLYVAGSSVFPTSGHANPTLTIVALSVRLAEHLETRIGGG